MGSMDEDHTARGCDRYLAENIRIVHPLLFQENAKGNQQTEQEKQTKTPSLEESLGLLHLQDARTCFGPLEMGLADDNQVLRHGYSSMPGFRGAIVQIFNLNDNRIVSIHVAKTMAPWNKRWWWFRRKSGCTKRVLWQTWWEEWEEEIANERTIAKEDLAFEKRLIESNFFVF